MDLVDTNVWLERLLGQARSEEVGRYLAETPLSHRRYTVTPPIPSWEIPRA